MLLRNLNVSQRLVNGAMGVVHQVDVNSLGRVEHIHILFDSVTSSSSGNASTSHIPVVIDAIEQQFVYAGRSIIRKDFPLSFSWACTIHKVEGITTYNCFVDLYLFFPE